MDSLFVIFSGLPGSGKSTLAEAIGRELAIPVFAKDWLDATLLRCELQTSADKTKTIGYAGYELLTTLVQRQLMLGQSVILDSVAGIEVMRSRWRDLAAQYAARWRVIECICTDETIHRARLVNRQRNIPGWHELQWAEVERVRSYYAAWNEAHLIVDTVAPMSQNLERVRAYLQ